MVALALAVLLCLGSGFALVHLGWPHKPACTADLLLQASLSIGFGLGVFSLLFFLALLFHFPHLLLIDGVMCALLFSVGLLLRRSQVPSSVASSDETPAQPPVRFHHLLNAVFAIAVAGALYSAIMRVRAYPHGNGWDAFAIWNLHARLMFRGGPNWRDGFTSLLHWSHPDYPLLLPAAIAHFWTCLGREATAVPAYIGFLFTFSTAGLLFSALSSLRGCVTAMLGAVTLLATPSFIEQGTSQYADVPLSFFVLATTVLLCLHDDQSNHDRSNTDRSRHSGFLALAGLAAGFAAWTKNEGLLFLCAILFACCVVLILRNARAGNWLAGSAKIIALLSGATPLLLPIAYFKLSIALGDELFAEGGKAFHKLLSPGRYWVIFQWYIKEIFRFGHWLVIPGTLALTAFYFLVGSDKSRTRRPAFQSSVLTLVLTLAGYFAIYVVTSYELYWHLRFSLNRLFLQLWPSAIFLLFLAVKIPEDRHTSANPQLSVSK
jgi:hypothetical protein